MVHIHGRRFFPAHARAQPLAGCSLLSPDPGVLHLDRRGEVAPILGTPSPCQGNASASSRPPLCAALDTGCFATGVSYVSATGTFPCLSPGRSLVGQGAAVLRGSRLLLGYSSRRARLLVWEGWTLWGEAGAGFVITAGWSLPIALQAAGLGSPPRMGRVRALFARGFAV